MPIALEVINRQLISSESVPATTTSAHTVLSTKIFVSVMLVYSYYFNCPGRQKPRFVPNG